MNFIKVTLIASLLGLSGTVAATETVIESFSDYNVGDTVDSGSAVVNVVSSEFSSDKDNKSWKISFTGPWQGNSLWGEWDWSNEKKLKIDVLNNSGSEQQVTVKLISLNTDWSERYNLYGGETLPSSDEFQTIEINLDAPDAGEKFTKSGVGGIQVMLGQDPSQQVSVYFDNIRVDDGKGVDEPTPEPGEIVVESFSEYSIGDVIDQNATSLSNLVSSDVSSDGDGKSWKIEFDDAYQGTSLWGEWSWSESDKFKFDVINNNDEAIDVVVKLISRNTDWTDSFNLYGGATLEPSTEVQTVEVNLDDSDAGTKFTKADVGGIQFMLGEKPTGKVSVYFDNIRVNVTDDTEGGDGDGDGDGNTGVQPPAYIGEGGSLGGVGLLILSLFALSRRNK